MNQFFKTSSGPGSKYSIKLGGWKTWWLGCVGVKNMVAGMRGSYISMVAMIGAAMVDSHSSGYGSGSHGSSSYYVAVGQNNN